MHKLKCALLSFCGTFCSGAVSLKWLSTGRVCWERSKAAVNLSRLFVNGCGLLLDVDGAVINQGRCGHS